MNAGGIPEPVQAAVAAVRNCADSLGERAAILRRALPAVRMDGRLRTGAAALGTTLSDTSVHVRAELAVLEGEIGDGRADAATVAPRLADLDQAMTRAVAAAAELAEALEAAAKRDETNGPAFELVIEAVGLLLQDLARAEAETHKLRTGESGGSEQTAVRW